MDEDRDCWVCYVVAEDLAPETLAVRSRGISFGVNAGMTVSEVVNNVKRRVDGCVKVLRLRQKPFPAWEEISVKLLEYKLKKDEVIYFKVLQQDDDPRAKRKKLVPESEVALHNQLVRANNRLNYIRESYSDPEFLWDPNSAVFLPYPSYSEVEEEGIYVGREAAKEFYDTVCHLSPGQRMLVIGAKGSGKSTVAKAIVGFLIASGKAALYLTISQIREKNRKALLSGLALAFPQKLVELSLLTNKAWEEMMYWCCTNEGPVFLFIDDWDCWDSKDDEFRQIDENFSGTHIRVKISSTNSEARHAYLDTDKPEEKYGKLYRLDGPYTEKELNTWIDNSGLLQEDEAKNKDLYLRLEMWTGGMPCLLKAFQEVQGDESRMRMKMEFYENRLKQFIDAAETTQDLHQRLCMVTRGAIYLGGFDSTCFYQDEFSTWHILCPYLQRKAESMIMVRGESLAQRLSLNEILTWARAVEYDCRLKRNPARLGWNVEGLIIGLLRYLRRLFKNQFGKCIEYLHGQEVGNLVNISEHEMQEGILMVPVKFNEEALDIFYIKLSDGKYILIAVQISVAKWKAKLEKGSQKTWKTEILKRLKPVFKGAEHSDKFVYIMPGKHDGEKEADFERECFGNIHECLKWIDQDFELTALTDDSCLPLQQCQGMTRLKQRCQAKGRYKEDNFRCRHHLQQAATYHTQQLTASSNHPSPSR